MLITIALVFTFTKNISGRENNECRQNDAIHSLNLIDLMIIPARQHVYLDHTKRESFSLEDILVPYIKVGLREIFSCF